MRKLADDLEKCGLTDSSIFKSLTCPKSTSQDDVEMTESIDDRLSAHLLSSSNLLFESVHANKIRGDPFFVDKINITRENALDVFQATIGQSCNTRWYKERKHRISSSMCLQMSRAKKPSTMLTYFFGMDTDNKHMQYGRKMEPLAVEQYEKRTGRKVLHCGLVIKPDQPWLCGSPDGVSFGPDGSPRLLEVKCPSSCENKVISVSYLVDGSLKKTHPYYAQTQMQMYVANVGQSDFFVFSQCDSIVLTVVFDQEFVKNLVTKLESLYAQEILPVLNEQSDEPSAYGE